MNVLQENQSFSNLVWDRLAASFPEFVSNPVLIRGGWRTMWIWTRVLAQRLIATYKMDVFAVATKSLTECLINMHGQHGFEELLTRMLPLCLPTWWLCWVLWSDCRKNNPWLWILAVLQLLPSARRIQSTANPWTKFNPYPVLWT